MGELLSVSDSVGKRRAYLFGASASAILVNPAHVFLIFPFTRRAKWTPVTVDLRPVGSKPANVPLCVPLNAKLVATISPSETMFTIRYTTSGNAVRKARTRDLNASRPDCAAP